jgi:hypothetical protein
MYARIHATKVRTYVDACMEAGPMNGFASGRSLRQYLLTDDGSMHAHLYECIRETGADSKEAVSDSVCSEQTVRKGKLFESGSQIFVTNSAQV